MKQSIDKNFKLMKYQLDEKSMLTKQRVDKTANW